MSRHPSLGAIYQTLIASLDHSAGLLHRAGRFEELRQGKKRRLLPADVQAIAELSFLSAFLSWENFLEASFTMYMLGKKSPSGFRPERYVLPPTAEHAFEIIAQGRKYADWVQVQDLRRRAQWYFKDGDPFWNAMGAIVRELDEMRLIRHRIAHMSNSAHKSFEGVVRNRLGSIPRRVTPGSYLLMLDATGSTYFDYYIAVLKAAALQIVPH